MFNKVFLVLAAIGVFFSIYVFVMTGYEISYGIRDLDDFGYYYMIFFSIVAVVMGIKVLKGK